MAASSPQVNSLMYAFAISCTKVLFPIIFVVVNIWRPRRKLLTPNFSSKNLQAFVKVFSKQSEILVERLASVADKRTFSIWKYFTAYSMDSVCGKCTTICGKCAEIDTKKKLCF